MPRAALNTHYRHLSALRTALTRLADSAVLLHASLLRGVLLTETRTGLVSSERIGIVTVLNDSFVPYFLVLLESLKFHNPWIDFRWLIFWSPSLSPLSEDNRRALSLRYGRLHFERVDEAAYFGFLKETPPRLIPALYSLECFRLLDFDRVVFLDADMLCLGDLSTLFQTPASFAACVAGRDAPRKQKLAGHYALNRGINTGVMVIGKALMGGNAYRRMFTYRSGLFGDQDIINRFFRYRMLHYLPPEYNCHAEFFWDDARRDPRVRILHFAGVKPLEAPDLPRMRVWFEYRARLGLG